MAKLTRAFQIRTTDEFVRWVDDWRRRQPDLPNRAEAFRRLAERGLEADQLALDHRGVPSEPPARQKGR